MRKTQENGGLFLTCTHGFKPFFSHAACSTTQTEVLLPPRCKYIEDGELYDSFFRTSCNLEQCTTGSGPCQDSDRRCCCRAIATEPIDVACDESSFLSGNAVSTNETHCACTICDDIEVLVSILVREPGEGGEIISGAQVVNKDTGELLGLTYTNGKMTFMSLAGARSVTVIVLAANYVPREHEIELVATRSAIEVVVALLPRHPVLVAPEDSGYTFRISDKIYITIPADGFQRNGSLYEDLVMFNGIYMNAQDDGFLDMVDSERLVLDKEDYFALSFFTYLSFSDPDGNSLVAQTMKYYLEVAAPQNNAFLTIFNSETDQWVNLGGFTETTNTAGTVEKRQRESVTFVQLNVALEGQLIFHASLTNISCWLQMRSFSDRLGTEAQGIIGRVIQEGPSNGGGFTFRFGTNTGSAQSNNDGLVGNAICLPLACDGFTRGTIESLLQINADSPQTPLDFPQDTFDASELGAPTRLGRFFTFQEVITHTPARPRPFYESVDDCIVEATIPSNQADRRSFFSFVAEDLARVPVTDQCLVKVRVTECVRNNVNQLIFFNETGVRSLFTLGNEPLIDESFSADHFFDNDCNEQSRIMCIPFNCTTDFQIAVRDHTVVDFCNVSMLAPIAQSQFVRQPSVPQTVQFSTDELALQDYNNPDLGLYYDPTPAVALDLCRDPLGLSPAQGDVSIEGYAVTFDCVGESTVDI